jgi:hypothetical protein
MLAEPVLRNMSICVDSGTQPVFKNSGEETRP